MSRHLIALIFLLMATTIRASTLHISPSGNDTNPGTESQPLATLNRALDEIRRHPTDRPFTVILHGGTYRQTTTFTLDASDSNTHWQAAPKESVRIDGGIPIQPSSFHPVTDPSILQRLPATARDYILVTDLSSLGIQSIPAWPSKFRGSPPTPELFFNDQRMQIARWPNQGWATINKVIDPGADPRDGDKSNRLPVFTIADPRPRSWNTDTGIWLYGHFTYDWYDEIIRVKSIDPATGQITLAAPAEYSIKSGRFYAMNLLDELDAPAEFYIDPATRKLYFYPPAPIDNAHITLSTLTTPILSINNAHDINISGITFENSLGDAIHIKDSTAVHIESCTIRNVNKQAIHVDGGSDDVVDSCQISNTGSGGIYLDGGDRRSLTPAHHLAINNTIHDFSQLDRFGAESVAIVVAGVGNRAAHNLIYNAPYQALWILGNDNLIEFNDIHNVVTDSADAGAIYKGRDPSCRGNIIRNNFFHDIGDPNLWGTCAIYFDDGDGGDTITGNIFLRAGHPGKWPTFGTIFSHGGFDIHADNNIFIDCKIVFGSAPWSDAEWKDVLSGGMDCNFPTKLLKDVDITSKIYTSHYPDLIGFMHPKPGQRRNSLAANNVLVGCENVSAGNWICDAKTTWSTKDDPGFLDTAHNDFGLRPDSEIFHHLPDFKPIPFDQIGPQSSQ